MPVGKYNSEHYLEYKIEASLGNYSNDEVSLYFERDASDALLRYKLFLVFKEWKKLANLRDDPSYKDKINSLSYNEVEVVYDILSTDCASLTNPLSKAYKAAEIKITKTVESYINDGGILAFNQIDKSFSGVGQILLWYNHNGKRELKGKFFLAINEIGKIKIDYAIKNVSSGINITLSCLNKGTKVDVILLENDDRLPCLVGDTANTIGEPKTLDFSQGDTINITYELPYGKQNKYYCLAFKNEEDEKLYILNLLYEDRFDKMNVGYSRPHKGKYFCPYCGGPLPERSHVSAYETNCIICSPYEETLALPKIRNKNNGVADKCIYCKKDTIQRNDRIVFEPSTMRVLPKDFYDHNEYKILLLGSVRAGKTTFLSRFFGLSSIGNSTNMNLRYIANGMAKFGVSINVATANTLDVDDKGMYHYGDTNYYVNAPFYIDRSISVDTGAFPMATQPNTDCERYPFVLETLSHDNKDKSYLVFYDIAGEDARTKQIKGIREGEASAIFLLINTIRDLQGNSAIINSLKSANIAKDTPIAVILTKFDLVSHMFNSSAHVNRVDYYDYEQEEYSKGVGREILASSMEIKSYLQAEGYITDLESKFTNVSYFALSSFNFTDSIRTNGNNFNEPTRLLFDNSTRRIELPLVWVMKQFGLL